MDSRSYGGNPDNPGSDMDGMQELYGEEGAEHEKGESTDEEHEDQPSALIPKSLLAGKHFNEGDEVVLKIKAIHGDEIEVEYAAEPGGGKGGEEESGASELEHMSDKHEASMNTKGY